MRGEQLERVLVDTAGWPAAAARDWIERNALDEPPTKLDHPTRSPHGIGPADRKDRLASVPSPAVRVAAVGRRILNAPAVLTRHDDWNIGVVNARIETFLHDTDQTVTWLPRRSGHFAADPFGVERDGVLHVLYEDYDQQRAYGSIAHIAISEDGSHSSPEIVLDPGVHASYPYLIEHDGTMFMLPETSASGGLVLFEAVDFPKRWRPAVTMLPGVPALDATVVLHAGTWWMFATRRDRGPNHSLFIWHATSLTGPWTEHEANPVKTDARSARPAGTPFTVDGRLYRPAQDDSDGYGGGIVLNQVDVLTPRRFVERPVKRLGPRPGSPRATASTRLQRSGAGR